MKLEFVVDDKKIVGEAVEVAGRQVIDWVKSGWGAKDMGVSILSGFSKKVAKNIFECALDWSVGLSVIRFAQHCFKSVRGIPKTFYVAIVGEEVYIVTSRGLGGKFTGE